MDNSLNVLRQICANLCLSIGMTIIILSGGIDLSVGSMLALAGAVAAGLLKNGVAIPGTDVFIEVTVSGAILAGVARRHGAGLVQRLCHHAIQAAAVRGDARAC